MSEQPLDLAKMKATIQRKTWLAAQPLDPAELLELERAGVIEKRGTWYRLLQPGKIPEHIMEKAGRTVRTIEERVALQFKPPTKRVRSLAARLGVDWQGPEPK